MQEVSVRAAMVKRLNFEVFQLVQNMYPEHNVFSKEVGKVQHPGVVFFYALKSRMVRASCGIVNRNWQSSSIPGANCGH